MNQNQAEDSDATMFIRRNSNTDVNNNTGFEGQVYNNRNNTNQQTHGYIEPISNSPSNKNRNDKKAQKKKKQKNKKSSPILAVIITTLILIIIGAVGTTIWFFGGIDMVKEVIGIESPYKSEDNSDKTDKSDKNEDEDEESRDSNVKHEKPQKNKKSKESEEIEESTEDTSTQINMPPTVSTDTMPTSSSNN